MPFFDNETQMRREWHDDKGSVQCWVVVDVLWQKGLKGCKELQDWRVDVPFGTYKGVKMNLQEQIVKDLRAALQEGRNELRDNLKVIVGELQRQDKKELPDDVVVKILKRLEKSELELLDKVGGDEAVRRGTPFLELLREYIPQMATDSEIAAWISSNVDFSGLKNKIQAVGIVMKNFGSRADGGRVRSIIQEMF
jgi:uncharacterized protein